MLGLLLDSFVSFPNIACFFYLVVEALKIFKVHALSKGLITIVIWSGCAECLALIWQNDKAYGIKDTKLTLQLAFSVKSYK